MYAHMQQQQSLLDPKLVKQERTSNLFKSKSALVKETSITVKK